MDQISNPNNPLHVINEVHCRALVESFQNYSYNFASGTMNVFVLSAVDRVGATIPTAVQTADYKKLHREGYYMEMLDGRHHRHYVKILRIEEEIDWGSALVRMRYAFCVDGKAFSSAQKIKLRNIANNFTAIGRRKAMLTDKIKSHLSYTRTSVEYCGVWFADVRILDIVEDMMFSKILATASRATYIRYFKVWKMQVESQGALPLLQKLYKDVLAAKTFATTNLDDPSLYVFYEEDIHHLIQAVDAIVKNNHTSVPFARNIL